MQKRKHTDFKVGLTVLIGIALLLFGIAWAKGWSFGHTSQLYAVFPSAGGAERGDPVYIRGIKCGTIASVIVGEHGKIVMAMDLDRDIPLFADASATIMMHELMGGKKVEILPGSNGEFKLGRDTLLGTSAGDMSSLVAMGSSLSSNIGSIASKTDSVLGALQALVGDPAFRDGVTAGIAEARIAIKDLTVTMQSVRSILAENKEALRTTIKQAEELTTNLNTTVNELKPSALATLESAKAFITNGETMMKKADALIGGLDDMISDGKTNGSLLYKLTADKAFAQRIDSVILNTQKLIKEIRYQGINTNVRIFQSAEPND